MTPEESGEVIKQAIIFGTDSSDIEKRHAAEASANALRNLLLAVVEIENRHNGK